MSKFTINAEVSVYFNDAGAGYKTLGKGVRDIERDGGDGFIVRYGETGGTALLYRRRMVGGRMTRFNVGATWKDILPMCCLPSLRSAMERMDEDSAGTVTLTLTATSFPAAEPAAVAAILDAVKNDSCVVFDGRKSPTAEGDVMAALARLPVSSRFSVAMPLPSKTAPCTVSVYPNDSDFTAGDTSKRVIGKIAGKKTDLSEVIAKAEENVVMAAVTNNSMRVYQLYAAMRQGKTHKMKPGDEQYLRTLLDSMDEYTKQRIIYENMVRPKAAAEESERTGLTNRTKLIIMAVCVLLTAAGIAFGGKIIPHGGVTVKYAHMAVGACVGMWCGALAVVKWR